MPSPWSRVECEAIVADYFDMFAKECRQESYSKAAHRRALSTKLQSRSDGSIEYKHQNISAVLIRAGQIYIRGYKPAWNYQELLEDVVLGHLSQRADELIRLEDSLVEQPAVLQRIENWESLFVEPPERTIELQVRERRLRVPRMTNYAERESRNRKLGESGEAFVVDLEQTRLTALGRQDLARDVEWTSKERGDGAGYDIRSFDGDTDNELFIEVKTTNSGKYQPFLISVNEVDFSNEFSDSYSLYRLFEFSRSPAVFALQGAVDKHVNLSPKLYSATF